MKKIAVLVLIGIFHMLPSIAVGQIQELEELALDIEKLGQFKQILSDLKKGYEILTKGYEAIREVSQGQFELHKVFLDGLLAVSPTVRKYRRVVDIVALQLRLVGEYKAALSKFRKGGIFSVVEIGYISSVYDNLVDLSLKDIDVLADVLTESKLRMSDDERITAIDHVYDDMSDKVAFIRSFNNSAALMQLQRARQLQGVKTLQQLTGKE